MANQLNQSPIIINAAMASYKAQVAATLGTLWVLRVERVYWEGPSTVGHQVVITDPANGARRMNLECAVANQGIDLDFTANPKLWSDFAVVQIDSGNLYIYLR